MLKGNADVIAIVFIIYMYALNLCKMQVGDGNSSVKYSSKQRDSCKGMKNLEYSFVE